jgi:hypothetical protein
LGKPGAAEDPRRELAKEAMYTSPKSTPLMKNKNEKVKSSEIWSED